MINMVGYTKFGFNQMCYTGTCPQVVGESCSMSTFQKSLFQLVACCGIKSWWTTGIVCCRKPLTALASICCIPTTNTASINTNNASNFYRCMPLQEKFYGMFTTLLQYLRVARGSHISSPPTQSIGHLLYRCQ